MSSSLSVEKSTPIHLPQNSLTDIHFWYKNEFSQHRHSYYEIILLTKGRATHFLDSSPKIIDKQELVIVKPGVSHKMNLFGNYTSEHLCISISETLFTELCNSINKKLFDQVQSNNFCPYANLPDSDFNYLLHLTDSVNTLQGNSEAASLLIKQIVFNILCFFSSTPQTTQEAPVWLQDFLQKLSDPAVFVQPLSTLYKYAPYSQSKLSTHFKAHVGTTLVAYLTKKKITYACNLLQNTNFSILKISTMLNYDSLAHFNRTFKKETGKTPREYRLSSQKY
jgi:quercetin dioxygenase-like cupin family protein